MKRGMTKPSKRKEETNMTFVLAELERSESIYFQQSFTQSQNSVQLALPAWFVQDHGFKIDKWIILRMRTTSGTSSRPWVVQLKTYKKRNGTRDVRFVDGWEAFAAHYRFKEGDWLIFLLSKEGARSEFEVYVFGKTERGTFSFLGPSDSSGESIVSERGGEEGEKKKKSVLESKNKTNLSVSLRPIKATTSNGSEGKATTDDGREGKATTDNGSEGKATTDNGREGKATTDNGGEGKALALNLTKHAEFPSFRKRLSASSIQRSDGTPNSGQFEFPLRFLKTHDVHLQPRIQFQGVHEDSPIYDINCRGLNAKQSGNLRVGLRDTEWSAFVHENNLQEGQELQISLTGDSYFVVRIV